MLAVACTRALRAAYLCYGSIVASVSVSHAPRRTAEGSG